MKAVIPAPPGKVFLPYQEKAIRFMAGARGTLLADEMGLGKTIQAIGFMNLVKPARTLIIAPKSLVLNWHDELEQWSTLPEPHYVTVTTYGKASRELGLGYDMVIGDEAHYIKNPASQRSQVIKALWKEAQARNNNPHVLLMTGTPIDVSPIDLWPLLQIVAPEEFDPPGKVNPLILSPEQKKSHPGEGPNFWEYAKRYCGAKVVRFPMSCEYEESNAGIGRCIKCNGLKETHKFPVRYRGAWDFSNASNLDELQRRLRKSCMVRRLKSDVLADLPEKRRQIVKLAGYNADDSGLLERIGFSDITLDNYDEFVAKLTANKVAFADWSKRRHEQGLAKVDGIIEFVDDVLDSVSKVILFAHHTDVILKLTAGLFGYDPVIVTGSTHAADRQAAVKRFQADPSCRLIIGSIGALGTGHTLTASSYVIFGELSPSLRDMSQAEDRAHRIGTRNMVLVQHLVVDGSLCARIAKILVRKQAVAKAALDLVQTDPSVFVSSANDCQAKKK